MQRRKILHLQTLDISKMLPLRRKILRLYIAEELSISTFFIKLTLTTNYALTLLQ